MPVYLNKQEKMGPYMLICLFIQLAYLLLTVNMLHIRFLHWQSILHLTMNLLIFLALMKKLQRLVHCEFKIIDQLRYWGNFGMHGGL